MTQFNSKKHGRRIYNSLRYASTSNLWTPSSSFDKNKGISLVHPSSTDGSLSGWSQISTHPQSTLSAAHKKMVEHYLFGCKAPKVESGRINEDGTEARSCNGCGGRWQGIKDPSEIPQRVGELFGIRRDTRNNPHYEGDECTDGHSGFSLIKNSPTVADYACLPVNIPGIKGILTVNDLLANAHTLEIGKTKNGKSIVPGRIEEPKTGRSFNHSAWTSISEAAFSNTAGMKRLVESGNTNLSDYFDIMRDSYHQHYGVTHEEIDKNHPDPKGYVGIKKGAHAGPFLDTVTDGSLQNIRRTLGTQGLDLDRFDPDGNDYRRHLWDMMSTSHTVQSFTPHHAFDTLLNPFDHVIDIQHANEAATSRDPGVRASYFAAFPGRMPGGIRTMGELGNRGKRDPHSIWMASDDAHHLIRGLVQRYKDYQDLRTPTLEKDITDFTAEEPIDLALIMRSTYEQQEK